MKKWCLAATMLIFSAMIAVGAAAMTAVPHEGVFDAWSTKSTHRLAKAIVNECTNPNMTQHEKAVALYDWLIDHTTYQRSTTNAYKVLRYGKASCGGYSNAYKVLLSKVGIKAKTINGRYHGLGHTWNMVYLDGNWYHVDVRMGDHLKAVEDRYRRFGMCDEQARLDYSFKGAKADAFLANYAYRVGRLNSAIAYVRSAIIARVEAGDKLFIVDLTARGAPSELGDPFNRITAKNALKNLSFPNPGTPDDVRLNLSVVDNFLLVKVEEPTYLVEKITPLISGVIEIVVADGDFSGIEPIDLRKTLLVEPSYATQPTLYWKSRKETVAIVDQDGILRIVGYGKATIKVATTDGSNLKKGYEVKVTRPGK